MAFRDYFFPNNPSPVTKTFRMQSLETAEKVDKVSLFQINHNNFELNLLQIFWIVQNIERYS